MKVHIVLKEEELRDAASAQAAVATLTREVPLSDVDASRLDRLGLITADIPADRLEAVRAHPSVDAVSVDKERRAVV